MSSAMLLLSWRSQVPTHFAIYSIMRRCSPTGLSVTVPWRWWSHTHGCAENACCDNEWVCMAITSRASARTRPRETWLANHPGALQKHNESEFTVANLPLSLWATSMRSGRIRQIKIAGFLLSAPGNWRWRANLYLKMQHDCLVPFRLILLYVQLFCEHGVGHCSIV